MEEGIVVEATEEEEGEVVVGLVEMSSSKEEDRLTRIQTHITRVRTIPLNHNFHHNFQRKEHHQAGLSLHRRPHPLLRMDIRASSTHKHNNSSNCTTWPQLCSNISSNRDKAKGRHMPGRSISSSSSSTINNSNSNISNTNRISSRLSISIRKPSTAKATCRQALSSTHPFSATRLSSNLDKQITAQAAHKELIQPIRLHCNN